MNASLYDSGLVVGWGKAKDAEEMLGIFLVKQDLLRMSKHGRCKQGSRVDLGSGPKLRFDDVAK